MRRFFSTLSTVLLVASALAPLGRVRAQEPGSGVLLPALTNGDVNGDWELDLSDAVALLGHLFLGGPEPVPVLCGAEVASSQNGDANGDGALNVSDAAYLLDFLFRGGPEPVSSCGLERKGAGGTIRIPVVLVATAFVVTGPPERVWNDADGVTHVRGAPVMGEVAGDYTGTDILSYNQNIDPEGNGDEFGTWIHDVTWAGQKGTFEGRFSAAIEGGVTAGRFVGQGTGAFDGMKIMGQYGGPLGGPTPHEAIVLIPGGE